VDFEHLDYIDHACIDLLVTWARQHEAEGGRLTIDWDSLHARFRSERRGDDTGQGVTKHRHEKPSKLAAAGATPDDVPAKSAS
jgi:hypothetical protein